MGVEVARCAVLRHSIACQSVDGCGRTLANPLLTLLTRHQVYARFVARVCGGWVVFECWGASDGSRPGGPPRQTVATGWCLARRLVAVPQGTSAMGKSAFLSLAHGRVCLVGAHSAGSSSAGGTAVAPKLTSGNSSWRGSLEGSGPEMARILVRLGLRKVLLLGGASSDRRCDRQCDELDSAGDLPRLPSTVRRVQMPRRRRRAGR